MTGNFNRRPAWRIAHSVLAAALLASALAGCIPLVIGGAAAGGALVATDRRTSGAQLEDEGIEVRALARLRSSPVSERVHVNITSYNRQVLITGEAANAQDKQTVEQIVKGVENVNSVVNELTSGIISSLAQRSRDALISGRIKASILDSKDLFLNAFKVFTENGTVYLMGRVTAREADRATNIARGMSDVQKVVRVFEIISEDELAGTLPRRASGAASAPEPSVPLRPAIN